VTVTDNELPVITCPPNTTVSGSGSPCGYPANQLSPATATDNCAVTSLASNAPTTLPAGPTVITWTAKDAANNARTCSRTVAVNCGTGADAKDEERYEVGGMKYEARTSLHPSSLILHPLSITLAPNPARESVLVELLGVGEADTELSVYDALGRVVWHRVLIAGTEQIVIDLIEGVFSEGHYQVNLRTDSTLITKPLVVTRR
jgi:hypothetical protein